MEKFQSKDLRLIGICLVVILASLFVLDKYFYQAFPEASIQFTVGREESKGVAEKFLGDLGHSTAPEHYRHSVIFSHDDDAKVFLERELGLEEAGTLMGSRVKLWRWSHRWFKPLQKEEWRVSVAPDGTVNGFLHEVQSSLFLSPFPDQARQCDFRIRVPRAHLESSRDGSRRVIALGAKQCSRNAPLCTG